ncbi:MAG: thiamine pyrophosphate-binding protein [Gaiellales bacterium]
MTGAEAVAAELVEAGIDTVFGIPGVYNVAVFEALRARPEIRTVAVRHEQGAAFMADGFARASGRDAACLLLPGCGVLNALTALSEAYADSSPVLALVSQVEARYVDAGRGLLHELTGQLAVVGTVAKRSERVTAARDIPQVLRASITAMRSGRRRPVQVELPVDVQDEELDWTAPTDVAALQEPGPSPEEIEAAAAALAGASRPLLIAGGGVVASGGQEALRRLAERLGAPVVTTGMGVTAIAADHPLACGVSWIASADVRPLVAASDAVLAIGTRFNAGLTANWELALPATTVRVDIDPEEIERNLPFAHKLVGDARLVTGLLDDALAERGVDRRGSVEPELAAAQRVYRAAQFARVGTTRPWFDALRAALPRDGIVSADMCLFWADMLGSFPFTEPRTMLFPWGMGTLGFGLPAAIGAKLALPDRAVVAVVGDGAFMFTGSELATAVQHGLPIPIIVTNNRAFGMIKKQQLERFGADVAVDLATPDFVALARSFGARGELAADPVALGGALRRAFAADLPTVIEVPWGVTFAEPVSDGRG